MLITKHAAQEDGTYLDPRSKQTFTFDHLRKVLSFEQGINTPRMVADDICPFLFMEQVATNPQPAAIDEEAEPFRAALDTATLEYAEAHYPAGISAVSALRFLRAAFAS